MQQKLFFDASRPLGVRSGSLRKLEREYSLNRNTVADMEKNPDRYCFSLDGFIFKKTKYKIPEEMLLAWLEEELN